MQTDAKLKMSRTGSRFHFFFSSSGFRASRVGKSLCAPPFPVQDVWTAGAPPAPLSEGSAQEPLPVGDRHHGPDHSPAGESTRVRDAGPGTLETRTRATATYLTVASRVLLTVPAGLRALSGRSELWRENKRIKAGMWNS